MSFFEPGVREADEGSFDAVSRQDLVEKARGVDMDDDGVVNLSLVEAEARFITERLAHLEPDDAALRV